MRHRVTDRVTEKPEGRSIPLGYPGPLHCSATTFGANGGTRTLDLLFTNSPRGFVSGGVRVTLGSLVSF